MADKYSCNSCGAISDTGYFYCEKCHRMHKEKKQKDNDKNECGDATKDTFISDREVLSNSSKEVINPDFKVKVS